MSETLYICDRKARDVCLSSCRHTSDPRHAMNFERDVYGNLWEVDALERMMRNGLSDMWRRDDESSQ